MLDERKFTHTRTNRYLSSRLLKSHGHLRVDKVSVFGTSTDGSAVERLELHKHLIQLLSPSEPLTTALLRSSFHLDLLNWFCLLAWFHASTITQSGFLVVRARLHLAFFERLCIILQKIRYYFTHKQQWMGYTLNKQNLCSSKSCSISLLTAMHILEMNLVFKLLRLYDQSDDQIDLTIFVCYLKIHVVFYIAKPPELICLGSPAASKVPLGVIRTP